MNDDIIEDVRRTTKAIRDISQERTRQVTDEGWTSAHDDEHEQGELAAAAACYAMGGGGPPGSVPEMWPWDASWWKPETYRRCLVKAGALIIAEIERLDRIEERKEEASE